jgi:hypothetical protein
VKSNKNQLYMSIKHTAPLPKTEVAKKEDTEKGAAVMATVKPTALVKKVDPLLDKVSKIADLQKKAIQLQRLKEQSDNLQKFKLKNSEATPDYLLIRAGGNSREEFETYNPFLIGKMLETAQREINAKIPQVEEELRESTI